MSCNSCKGKSNGNSISSKTASTGKVGGFLMKLLTFTLALVIMPLVIPLGIYIMFKHIFLEESVDVTKAVDYVAKQKKKHDKTLIMEEGDEIEYDEDFNPEDYELVDVDVIK